MGDNNKTKCKLMQSKQLVTNCVQIMVLCAVHFSLNFYAATQNHTANAVLSFRHTTNDYLKIISNSSARRFQHTECHYVFCSNILNHHIYLLHMHFKSDGILRQIFLQFYHFHPEQWKKQPQLRVAFQIHWISW